MTESTFKALRACCIAAGIILSLVVIYNIAVYFFVFLPNFGRDRQVRTEKSETEFYGGEENYKKHLADVDYINSLNLPFIETRSRDNLLLKAYLWQAQDEAKGTALLMHGFHSSPLREFSYIAQIYHKLGYNVVMPFQRGHGMSEGDFVTFGIKEKDDVHCWLESINSLFGNDKPVFIEGISMGSATVTMAAGEKFPFNVRGVVADCGFTQPYEIVRWTMLNKKHIWPGVASILLKSAEWYCRHLGDFSLSDYSTLSALNKASVPFLFITGTDDHTVPYEMTMSNFLLYKQRFPDRTRLVLFEDAPHAVSYMFDSEKYEKEITRFVRTLE